MIFFISQRYGTEKRDTKLCRKSSLFEHKNAYLLQAADVHSKHFHYTVCILRN